ncbi:DEAD/DEAH box helicase family protein [Oribacterium sp. FC2011]|uniref:DEAD/DEAH box helicase family protein n=1 Tax=Oribacterium sp. FC2011 TaxID=1408311 RepID=UPI0004E2153C|nr:DEAD/DEAH box helicase family protein [Oribacterium sp. FC2011]
MKYENYYQVIDIEKSTPNNRTLILPHQQKAVESLKEYFCLTKDVPDRNGMLIMPTGSGKTFTTVHWLMRDAVKRNTLSNFCK